MPKNRKSSDVCFENLDGEVPRITDGAALCLFGFGESMSEGKREKLWYCIRMSGGAKKSVRVVQDMYDSGDICGWGLDYIRNQL